MATRSLIVNGSIWRAGSGHETRIWKNSWLPSTNMVQIQGQIINEDAKVAELINEEKNQWDRERILELLGPANAVVI